MHTDFDPKESEYTNFRSIPASTLLIHVIKGPRIATYKQETDSRVRDENMQAVSIQKES